MPLTQTDIDLLRSKAPDWWDENDIRKERMRAELEMSRFKGFYHGEWPSEYLRWAARVLEDITEGCFEAKLGRRDWVQTITDLKAAWSSAVQESWETHRIEREDPEYADYLMRAHGTLDRHPWENNLEFANWWLDQTPYVVWRVKDTVEKVTLDAVRDALLEFPEDDVHVDVKRTADETYDNCLEELKKRFRAETKEKAA